MTEDPPWADLGKGLTLDDYQRFAASTDLDPESYDPIVPLLGLAGEVGSLATEHKKRVRPGGQSYVGFDNAVPVELGDILWYLATLARRSGFRLSEVALLNLAKTREGTSQPMAHSPFPMTMASQKTSGYRDVLTQRSPPTWRVASPDAVSRSRTNGSAH